MERKVANVITTKENSQSVSHRKQSGTAVVIKIGDREGFGENSAVLSAGGVSKTLKATEYKSPIMTAIPITLSGHEADTTEQETAHTLNANDSRKAHGTHQAHTVVAVTIDEADIETQKGYNQRGVVHSLNGVSRTIMGCGHAGNEPKVAVPVLTPDRAEKRQNGRRFKENGEEMFTLTAQDKHGVMVDVANTEQTAECENESVGFPQLTPIGGYSGVSAEFNRGILEGVSRTLKSNKADAVVALGVRNGLQEHQSWRTDGKSPTLTAAMGMGGGCTSCVQEQLSVDGFSTETDGNSRTIKANIAQTCQANLTRTDSFGTTGVIVKIADETQITEHPDVYVQLSEDCTVYAVWLNKYNCYVAIRKLTPKECFRLQGFSDEYFEKAQFVNSDSQLYKQAGNGVTTNVVRVIADRLAEIERSTENEQL